jgi:ParB family chromosome partitioning protein
MRKPWKESPAIDMAFERTRVPRSAIDYEDETYRITTEDDIEHLCESIKILGLLNAPVLARKGGRKTSYVIVAGFRRIDACRTMGWSRIPAKIAPSNNTGEILAHYAIGDNAFQRPLNLIEQSRALHLLAAFSGEERSLSQAASLFKLPESDHLINKVLKLSQLSESIQKGVLEGALSLSVALELGVWRDEAADRLAKLFAALRLSLGKQRDIISLVKEIAKRESISRPALVNESWFSDIVHLDADRTEKIRWLRSYLKQRRFPALAAAEAAFKDNLRSLELKSGMRMTVPRNFESPVYALQLEFKSADELSQHLRNLEKIIHNPVLETILSR